MIKFRAWHIPKQIMCEVIRIDFKQGIVTLDLEPDDDEYYWTETDLNISHVMLMQCTGLKDQSGVEIYEGDILYFEPYKTHSNDRVVEYIDGAYRGRLIRNGYSKLLAECVYETKVIGNIWEDGDLIDSERTKTY